jgi:hypothetical protein
MPLMTSGKKSFIVFGASGQEFGSMSRLDERKT